MLVTVKPFHLVSPWPRPRPRPWPLPPHAPTPIHTSPSQLLAKTDFFFIPHLKNVTGHNNNKEQRRSYTNKNNWLIQSCTFHGEHWQEDVRSDSDSEASHFSTDGSRVLYLFLGTCCSRLHHPIIHHIYCPISPPPSITITSPSPLSAKFVHSSVHGSLHPFVSFPKKNFKKNYSLFEN